MPGTASIAKNIFGDELYQGRARAALPLLVRQAIAQEPIIYSHLAAELGMPNARNLNYVLGSIGTTLQEVAAKTKKFIPPLTAIVVNQQTGLPGEGVSEFIGEQDFARLPRKEQRLLVDKLLSEIYIYKGWSELLSQLGLDVCPPQNEALLEAAGAMQAGGEGPLHKQCKQLIYSAPELLKLPKRTLQSEMESRLPSGDVVDVLFKYQSEWVAVEVKSRISTEADIVRGLYQCVKYRALIEAYQITIGLAPSGRVILALESEFPQTLLPIKNMLGITVEDTLGQYLAN